MDIIIVIAVYTFMFVIAGCLVHAEIHFKEGREERWARFENKEREANFFGRSR